MPNEGATEFGSIKAILTLDKSDYVAGLKEAGVQADELGRHDPTIRVEIANAAQAIAELKAVDAAAGNVDRSNQRVENSSRGASRGMGALATAVITLGPALVPLAGATVGLAAGFGGMGAAGVLAIVGIRNEMKAGTTVGLQYTSALDGAKTDLNGLAKVAAGNVLGPFQNAVRDLNQRMPGLRTQVGDLATVTGKTAGAITTGLLAAFQALGPLMSTVAAYTLNLSTRFETLMSGHGVVAFGQYVQSVFPQVMGDVESLVQAAIRLVAAFAPLGMGTLSTLRLLTDLINAIPVDVLSTIATAAGAVFIGFRTWQALSGPINSLSKALDGGLGTALANVGVSARVTTTALRTLQVAAGGIGIALAALSLIMSRNAESQRQMQGNADNLTQALITSNGAITEQVRLMALQNAQNDGAVTAARTLGVGVDQVTNYYLGQASALDNLSKVRDDALARQKALVDAGKADASTMTDVETAYLNLANILGVSKESLATSKQAFLDHKAVVSQSTSAVDAQTIALQGLANQYGVTPAIMQAVTTAQQGLADKAAAATLQMQMENDAAGILKQSLDLLNGKALSAADAQNAFDSSLANMGDHVDKTGKKIHFTTTSINNMSAASVGLRGQLNGQISNLQRVVEANGGLSNSTGKARDQMIKMRQQIIDNAVAHGIDRKAVESYIDKILKIPKSVPPTKLDIDKKQADLKIKAFQEAINGVRGKAVTLSVLTIFKTQGSAAGIAANQSYNNISRLAAGNAGGGLIGRAGGGPVPGYAGGTIVGTGTGTSDSILAITNLGNALRVSNGEYISTDASRRRNEAALAAGNRGATLEVAGQGSGKGVTPDQLEILLMRVLAELRRNPLRAQITAGGLDAAMGGRL